MRAGFPANPREFVERGQRFWTELRALKESDGSSLPLYPYDSLSSLAVIRDLLKPVFAELAEGIAGFPAADLGCGDGDFSLLLASFGLDVDAIDYAPTNFNGMRGIEWLRDKTGLAVQVYNLDLDSHPQLPRESYGLTLFLGTLYHLKNPYAVLELLAHRTRWCILSTRIAAFTAQGRVRIEDEPVAYLAHGAEIGNDATNYWIFSAGGLFRILQRTRWAISGWQRAGCVGGSNPVDAGADERMFVVLKSRIFYPELQVEPLEGWHAVEEDARRWTAKQFSLGIVLPLERPIAGFGLWLHLPGILFARQSSLAVSCFLGEELLRTETYSRPGAVEFAAPLPLRAAHEPVLRLDFSVASNFRAEADGRELGVSVPLVRESGTPPRIPFTIH